jgi:cytochrome b pre-mRNA-processing protein 3
MLSLFKKKRDRLNVGALYQHLVERSRHPVFYTQCGVPDTIDGRFDLLGLHVHLVLRDIRRRGQGREPLGQAVFDAFFGDLDQGLRESGVGDLSVAKKIRKMAEAFYGRAAAYDAAMGQAVAQDARKSSLSAAIARNVLQTEPNKFSDTLAAYSIELEQSLSVAPLDDILSGNILRLAPNLTGNSNAS